eukprot:CAMPEP_0198692972 /NCGR_PEP_ID=MMETSP1468-20131203/240054_1 /TAXON_ID=1461545 /ORGANISM="Mantoniella sp, Strain CCMP1436" /LENGTH=95 /DNA_ID=CAMNT_0044447291 /DNA_START=291 /DNA_END=575 /DNA_ORIENTATION=-
MRGAWGGEVRRDGRRTGVRGIWRSGGAAGVAFNTRRRARSPRVDAALPREKRVTNSQKENPPPFFLVDIETDAAALCSREELCSRTLMASFSHVC